MGEYEERIKRGKNYVLVVFNTFDGRTCATIVKDFYTKKQAEAYQNKWGLFEGHEVMTTKKYYNEALLAM